MPTEIASVLVVPLITGLVEAAKRSGLPERHAALAAMGCGLAIAVGAHLATDVGARPLYDAALQGIALGLAASGLYSVARAVTGDKAQRRPRAEGRTSRAE
jgi:hypothetical protein